MSLYNYFISSKDPCGTFMDYVYITKRCFTSGTLFFFIPPVLCHAVKEQLTVDSVKWCGSCKVEKRALQALQIRWGAGILFCFCVSQKLLLLPTAV